jgi:microcystin-dependent protein
MPSTYDATIGQIMLFAGTYTPEGYAECDGRLLPITENVVLYSLLRNTYGGDGVNTFALPDLRDRLPVHWGAGPLGSRQLGSVSGTASQAFTPAPLPQDQDPAGSVQVAAFTGDPSIPLSPPHMRIGFCIALDGVYPSRD